MTPYSPSSLLTLLWTIDGKQPSPDISPVSFEISDGVNKVPSAKLTLHIQPHLLNEVAKRLAPGKIITLSMGWNEAKDELFRGAIEQLNLDQGIATLELVHAAAILCQPRTGIATPPPDGKPQTIGQRMTELVNSAKLALKITPCEKVAPARGTHASDWDELIALATGEALGIVMRDSYVSVCPRLPPDGTLPEIRHDDQVIDHYALLRRDTTLQARMVLHGNSKIRPGTFVNFCKFEGLISGRHLIWGVQHSMKEGDWHTTLDIGVPPAGQNQLPPMPPRQIPLSPPGSSPSVIKTGNNTQPLEVGQQIRNWQVENLRNCADKLGWEVTLLTETDPLLSMALFKWGDPDLQEKLEPNVVKGVLDLARNYVQRCAAAQTEEKHNDGSASSYRGLSYPISCHLALTNGAYFPARGGAVDGQIMWPDIAPWTCIYGENVKYTEPSADRIQSICQEYSSVCFGLQPKYRDKFWEPTWLVQQVKVAGKVWGFLCLHSKYPVDTFTGKIYESTLPCKEGSILIKTDLMLVS